MLTLLKWNRRLQFSFHNCILRFSTIFKYYSWILYDIFIIVIL